MKIERPKSKQPIPEDAKMVFKGVMFDVYQWEQEMYDGTTKTFERLKRPDTVIVIPILPNGDILLVEEQQPGVAEKFSGPPGGRVDEGEDVTDAAKRELREETGYTGEVNFWFAQQVVGKLDWVVWYFLAKKLKKGGEQELDGGEKITLAPVTFEKFTQKVTDTSRRFSEPEIRVKFLEAKLDPQKKKELEELFKP